MTSTISNTSDADKQATLHPLFDIPELVSLIVSYLPHSTLAVAARVSSTFHQACTPQFWRQIVLDTEEGMEAWGSSKGFRMGLIRYGRFVEELHLNIYAVQDGDLELIAENLTRLKLLNLSGSNVTAETLKVLIHSDPYKTRTEPVGTAKKRKATNTGSTVRRKSNIGTTTTVVVDDENEEEDELDRIGIDESVDADTKMLRYREYTETETEYEPDSQYESVGIANPSSSAPESEQERPTGSIPRTASTGHNKARRLAGNIPLHRQSGTTRPAKFKGTKTQFPFYLEELVLNRCSKLSGPTVLEVLARLGPQLKKVDMNHVADLTDKDLLSFAKHVPNLVELNIKGTDVTDTLLKGLAEMTSTSESTSWSEAKAESRKRPGLTGINLNMVNVTPAGLIPLIKANKSTFKSISFEHNHHATDDTLYAFIEVPVPISKDKSSTIFTKSVAPRSSSKKAATERPSKTLRAFDINSVLTYLQVSYCTALSDDGFATLFKAATELQSVEIDGTSVGDEALLALATNYRTRMERLGYGTPATWREFEIAEDAVLIADHAIKPSRPGAAALARKNQGYGGSKIYHGHYILGGLIRLSLKHCPRITNKGIRAIVRSCVNLQSLDVSNCGRLSVEIFNGPWACTELQTLMIAGMPLEVAKTASGYVTLSKEEALERRRFPLEEEDYPLRYDFDYQGDYNYIVYPAPGRRGLSNNIYVDSDSDDDEEGEEEEENDELVTDENMMEIIQAAVASAARKFAAKGKAKNKKMAAPKTKNETIRYTFPDGKTKVLKLPPPEQRNTPAQRALLKQFYSKLGLLHKMYYLDMSLCPFRVRPMDGLHLALPGLTKSLVTWNMYRPGFALFDSDLEFFGRYFGCGHTDCPIRLKKLDIIEQEQRIKTMKKEEEKKKGEMATKDHDKKGESGIEEKKKEKGEDQKKKEQKKSKKMYEDEDDEDEDEDDEDTLPRVSKLDTVIVSKFAVEVDLDNEVYEWFMDQGVDLDEMDEFDYSHSF
ncbi:hypothetical protein FBU30_002456 [Linnemannia zychae]|nr:hypothetical protein FBU30_002456 [Linnemannia zychae]